VVPDSAECLVELRMTPDQPSAEALVEVQALLEPQWRAEAELIAGRDGWRQDEAGPAAALSAAMGAALNTDPTFDAPYWMEAPLWQQLCPTLVCGPGGGGLHAVDEWVDLNQVRTFTNALVQVLPLWTVEA
jgi:acetylornithine deacetylase